MPPPPNFSTDLDLLRNVFLVIGGGGRGSPSPPLATPLYVGSQDVRSRLLGYNVSHINTYSCQASKPAIRDCFLTVSSI